MGGPKVRADKVNRRIGNRFERGPGLPARARMAIVCNTAEATIASAAGSAAVLNWSPAGGIDLKPWLAVSDYFKRMLHRSAVARAWNEEMALYKEEQRRHAS